MRQKVSIAILVVVVVVGAVLLAVLGGNEDNYLNENELVLNKFEYSYRNMVSHSCPSEIEQFSFFLDGVEFTITASEKSPVDHYGLEESETPEDCVSEGALMNFYNDSNGLSEGLPEGCVVIEQIPSSSNLPELLIADCELDVGFVILDSQKLNSCISGTKCELVNGVDVEIIS